MSDAERRAAARAAGSVGPGTLVGLHKAVVARCEEIAEAFWGLEKKTGTRAPVVYQGWIPPKTGEAGGEQFPNILVSPSSGADSPQGGEQAAIARVDLFVATYGDEDDAWLDVLHVIQAIRDSFLAEPVVGGAYVVEGEMTWSLPDEQRRPQWRGLVTIPFLLPRPRRIDEREPTKEL